MNNFKSFNIQPAVQGLKGDKIKIDKVFNKEIVVEDWRIEDSKYKGKCLHMQIIIDSSTRVVFTGSVSLLEMIQKVDRDKLPFKTIILKDNDRYEFT